MAVMLSDRLERGKEGPYLFFEGEISPSVGKVMDVTVPVVYVGELVPAEVAHEASNASAEIVSLLEETIPSKSVMEETLTPTDMVREKPNTPAGLVVAAGDDSEEEFTDFNYEAYDNDNSDMEAEGVDVMVTSGSAAGNPLGDSFVVATPNLSWLIILQRNLRGK